METAFIMFCGIISSIDTHYKRAKWQGIAHLSFCLKLLIYMYLLKTNSAPGEPMVRPVLSPGLHLEQI